MKRMRRLDVVMADEPFLSSELALAGLEIPLLDATVEGGAGSDSLQGTTADDILIGRGDRDILFGDEGNDSFRYELLTDSTAAAPDLILDLQLGDVIDLTALQVTSYRIAQINGIITLTATTATGDLVVHSQNAIAVDHILLGNSLVLTGTAGADQLLGANMNDVFRLETGGADSAIGGAGDDLFYYGPAYTSADSNNGGAGTQDVVVLQGDYGVTMGATSLVDVEYLVLYSGTTTRFGDLAGNRYDYDITTVDANVGAGKELRVNGLLLVEDESFNFNGSAESNGYFLVYGGSGVDNLVGGAGGDGFYFEGTRFGAGDRVDGGLGSDVLILRGVAGLNTTAFGADQLTGIEFIVVSDRFATTPSQLPSYELVLANGNVPASGTLTVNGFALLNAQQIFNVDGSAITAGNLRLFGGAGDDALVGGAGNDLIYGVGGGDTVTGGGGGDTFQLRSLSDSTTSNPDRIMDFTSGSDRIDLSGLDANGNVPGDQAFSFIGAQAFQGNAGELRAYDTGLGHWAVEGDVNGDGVADFALEVVLASANPLASQDFIA